jgi:glyoxylase-like metal-dependent hydrolase (beta-lactamase superfamily II)
VKDNFYVLRGGGGATEVFITQKNGIVVVDAKVPGQGAALVEKIKSLTDKPISTLIITHTHPDHSGGAPEFPAGIQIVAQENTKANMEKMDLFKKPGNEKFLPNKTYKNKLKLFSGPDEVDVYYFGPGGTSGDSWIVFPALRIMAAGDDFAAKGTNYMDVSNGGSGLQAKTIRAVVNNIKNVDTVVPGHAPVLYTWADMKEYAEFNEDFLQWALAEKKSGKSVDEAAAEYKSPEKYAGYAAPNARFVKANLQAIYDDPTLK